MELKQKLTGLRKSKGLTQLELAEALSVSRQAVSRWEVGTAVPSLDNLVSLSRLYNVPVDYLVHDELEKPEETKNEPADSVGSGRRRTAPVRTLALALCVLIAGVVIGVMTAEQRQSIDMRTLPSLHCSDLIPAVMSGVEWEVNNLIMDIKTGIQIELSKQTFPELSQFNVYGHTLIGYIAEGRYNPEQGNDVVIGSLQEHAQEVN